MLSIDRDAVRNSALPAGLATVLSLHILVLLKTHALLQGSFGSRGVQFLSIGLACVFAIRAALRSKGPTRNFWLLSSAAFAVLLVAVSGIHFEFATIGFRVIDFLFLVYMLPFGLALLVNAHTHAEKEGRWPLVLDYIQVIALVLFLFAAFLYVPAAGANQETQRRLFKAFGAILVTRNVSITVGFWAMALLSVEDRLRLAFRSMATYLLIYTAGSVLTQYVFFRIHPPPNLIELQGSFPFLVGAWLFARWHDLPASRPGRVTGLRRLAALHLVPACLPVVVLICALLMSKSQPRLAWFAASSSMLVFALRLLATIYSEYQASQALHLSEERYRSLVLASSQIVWTANAHGQVCDDQPSWRRFTGQSQEEIEGAGWTDVLYQEDRSRTLDTWARAMRDGAHFGLECRLRRYDGEYRDCVLRGVPLLAHDGQVREWIGTCTDISERKRAEREVCKLNDELEQRVQQRTAELEEVNRELEAFSYSVSHDLRAPLRAIDGFARILSEQSKLALPPDGQHCLDLIRNGAKRMGEMIEQLLAFSRLGQRELSKTTVLMPDVVQSALADVNVELGGRPVDFVIGDLPCCEADPSLLRQVYTNLLSNAIKYTRRCERGRIEVGALRWADCNDQSKKQDSRVVPLDVAVSGPPVYFVRDNGVGFDMRYADQLFGVFKRLHSEREFEGNGVGLAIVRRIIHKHGGRIWAHSAVGEGATFCFTVESTNTNGRPEASSGPEEERRLRRRA